MTSGTRDFLRNYLRDRFKVLPWFLLPLYLWTLFGTIAPIRAISSILTTLLFLFGYRLLDDFFSRPFDLTRGRQFHYLESSQYDRHLMFSLTFSIVSGLFCSFLNVPLALVHILFLAGSILLYTINQADGPLLKCIPLVKYIFLPFVFGGEIRASVYSSWLLAIIFFEMIDSKNKNSINYVLFLIPLFIRFFA